MCWGAKRMKNSAAAIKLILIRVPKMLVCFEVSFSQNNGI